MKEQLGKQIEALRKECGVSTYELEKKGIHPSLPATIEKGQKGYTMDTLIRYLNAIDDDIFLSVEKKEKKKIYKDMKTYFVVRDTDHPKEDLNRNWSAFAGGSINGELGGATEEEAIENFANHLGISIDEVDVEFRYHPAFDEFVAVHYEGLGGYFLGSETLEEAIKEADEYMKGLAVTMESGDGHFYAEDVVSFHKVRKGRYIFEIKA